MAGGRFVGVSTDVVFDGRGGAPYAEADPVHPLGAYGACKAEMEGRLTAMGDNVLVCRTSLILSMAGAGGGGLPRSASSNGSDGGTGGGTGGGGGAVGGAAAAPAAAPAAAEAAEGATMATATPTTAAAADAATPAAATAADDVPPAALASLDVPMGKGLRFVADCVAGRKGAIALFTDELRQMSWADDLGAALVELAARRGVGGVLHLVADAPTTRWEVACVLARRAGLPAAGAALSGLSTESGLGRPVDLRLSTERLASLGLRTRLRGAIERLEALP
ncbi:hypothetical protein I4F81_009543 [Pyropia yezoensis]|uniref:Uncharacterized protein n=1 Tax=Pyropia yezoensis TaxID=2788 RepID=A0ACC3CB69_PYRYE|nr:hypothetical protein I4F81_009543 [Neopyropia yezoensis]